MEYRIIDVAIGLVLAFLVVSVLVSAIQEFAAGWFESRATQLEKGIKCLLFGSTDPLGMDAACFINKLFAHPLLYNLSKNEKLPSYIPASNFSRAIADIATKRFCQAGRRIDGSRALVEAVRSEFPDSLLVLLAEEAQGDLEHFRRQIEEQYGHMMDRVSGWYKRRAQWAMLFYGFAVAAALNIDATQLTQRLWTDPVAREQALQTAKDLAAAPVPDANARSNAVAQSAVVSALPVGWPTDWSKDENPDQSLKAYLRSLIGWLVTAIAASLGAPFWFDTLGKLVNLRGAGNKPDSATKGESKPTSAPTPAAPLAVRQSAPDERNALIDHHAERNRGDESYRPVNAEEKW